MQRNKKHLHGFSVTVFRHFQLPQPTGRQRRQNRRRRGRGPGQQRVASTNVFHGPGARSIGDHGSAVGGGVINVNCVSESES